MSTQMMKAVQQHAFGGPEVLSYEDAPMPVLQAGEVLVQVHAVGVNPPDSYLRDGYQQLSPEWRSATKCMLWRVFPKGRQGAAALTPSTLACRSATSLANP